MTQVYLNHLIVTCKSLNIFAKINENCLLKIAGNLKKSSEISNLVNTTFVSRYYPRAQYNER